MQNFNERILVSRNKREGWYFGTDSEGLHCRVKRKSISLKDFYKFLANPKRYV